MSELSSDHLKELGAYCDAFLADHRWDALWEHFKSQQLATMLATQAHETKRRESVYFAFLGAHAFIAHMQTLIAHMDHMVSAEPAVEPEFTEIPDVNDTRGFTPDDDPA